MPSDGEGITRTAQFYAVLGICAGFAGPAVMNFLFGGPLWNEHFALLTGLIFLAYHVEYNLSDE